MVRLGGRVLTLAAFAVLLWAAPALAQTGRVSGAVRDARGVALSGATVTVTNQTSGASRSARTGADGSYTIADLTPGTYTVSAALLGLRKVSQNVQIGEGAAVLPDFVLQPVVLEAVTVTALLREEELADVPFSIAAPTAEVLEIRGADNIELIATSVAGFSVQNLGPGQSQVAMRGASSGQIARDQPGVKEQVGMYLDDTPVSLSLFTPDLDLFDVARVEVLRGPQGTLFGAGSLSGTVRYISNEPELGSRRVFGELGMHRVDGGGSGNTAKFGFNMPVGEKAALRVVGWGNTIGGWMDAVQPNFQLNDDVNSSDRSGFRAALRLVPSDRFSITPRLVYQRVRADGWNRIDDFNILANPYTTTRPAVDLGDRELFTQIQEPYSDDFFLGDVKLDIALGGATLTSITAFNWRDILVVRDAGALTSSITGGTIGLPENIYTLDAPLDDATQVQVWTQELRLAGGGDRLKWVAGGFFAHSYRHYGQRLLVYGFDTLAAPILGAPDGFTDGLAADKDELFWSDLSYNLDQMALFGEATVRVGPRLDLIGGLRWYRFEEDRGQVFDGIFAHDSTGTTVLSVPGSTDASGVAPRIMASFRASDAVTLNAQASQGFRLGGINDPLNLPLCSAQDSVTFGGRDSWDDETAWNYEVGARSRFAGGRAGLNVSAFYMDIRDLQVVVTAGTCSSRLVFNVPKAASTGLELELTAAPSEHLDFSIAATLTNAELKSTVTSDTGGGTVVVSGIQDGNRLPSVPEVQLAAAATYQFQVGADSRGFFTGTFSYIGSRYTLVEDQVPGFGTVDLNSFAGDTIGGPLTQPTFTFDPLLPAYSLVNLRTGLIRDAWEIAVFVNNVLDERAYLGLDRERGTRARVGYLTNQPRTFGVSLRFSY